MKLLGFVIVFKPNDKVTMITPQSPNRYCVFLESLR